MQGQIGWMTSKMTVTIVMATYQSAATVRQALDSICVQKYPYIETIVIDGASTDGTLEILKEYQRDGKIAKLVSEPDYGIFDAMNKGIRLATGDIIGFLGSDDYYLKDAVSSIVKGFEISEADLVYGGIWRLYPDQTKKYTSQANSDIPNYVENPPHHQSLFVRTELQKQRPFDLSYRVHANYRFMLMLFYEGYKFFHIDVPIAVYRMDGFSSTHHYLFAKDMKNIMKEMINKYALVGRQKKIAESYASHNWMGLLQAYMILRLRKNKKRRRRSSLPSTRSFVIFGTGVVGKRFAEIMASIFDDDCISKFWDNHPKRETWNHIPIVQPERNSRDALILIASSKYEDEMAAQLEGLGYVRGRDYLTWSDAVEKLAALYARRRWHFGGDVACALEAP